MGLTKKFILNPTDVMTAVLAGDGPGSLLDADMVDGQHAADLLPAIDPATGHWIVGGVDTGVGAIAPDKASTAEATAGTNDTKYMTPATTAAAINAAFGTVTTFLDEINGEMI